MSLCHSLLPGVVLSTLVVLGATSCAGAVESSRVEDRARRTIPVPICLKALERHGGAGVVSVLKPQDYWALILPSYDPGANTVDRSSPDCSGRPVFDNPELAQAEGVHSGALVAKPDDAIVQPGPDDLRIVWLRTHKFADGTAAGPLALVRPREGYAEVYATGFYHGREKNSRFSLERMGTRFAVTAGDEGCSGVKPNRPCESSYQVFIMASGKLVTSAQFALERVDYRSVAGVPGPVQYRLTAMPTFEAGKLTVTEQLILRDENQSVIRKSDMVRVFKVEPDGRLVTKQESLWKQVANQPPPPPPPPPEPPAPEPKGKHRLR
jgi:hypothetical protein